MESVGYQHKELGIFLGFDYKTVTAMKFKDNSINGMNLELLHRWVTGEASEPTWEKLIEVARRMELKDLTARINEFMSR